MATGEVTVREERKVMILKSIGKGILAVLKVLAWLIIGTLNLLLGALKLFLLLFALVARVVLAFVRIGTP